MGSKSIRDGDSPSASSFLLPLLRHSRRGSLASLASVNQIDKETLSQALDQIHNSASQTETLTTFNEYTPPPTTSAGPDSKSIASELQGGFSGLYSRFRASVGNVKDKVNPGSEDLVAENPSLKSSRTTVSSPKPPSENASDSARAPSSSATTHQIKVNHASGRRSLLDANDIGAGHHDAVQHVSKISLESTSASTKSVTGSLAALKSAPTPLTQAAQPSTISPALAEVNISAVKQTGSNPKSVSGAIILGHPDNPKPGRISRAQTYLAERPAPRDVNTSGSDIAQAPELRSLNNTDHSQQAEGIARVKNNDPTPSLSERASANGYQIVASAQSSVNAVQIFPDLGTGSNNTEYNDVESYLEPAGTGEGQDDLPSARNRNLRSNVSGESTRKREYQHLDLPSRKTLAPPVISRPQSPTPSLSQASSSDTDYLNSASVQKPSRASLTKTRHKPQALSMNPQPSVSTAAHRESRTMSVFSQVKNKVLNKEYWMKDENARDCFYCGDQFSTFRRKHHCSMSAF